MIGTEGVSATRRAFYTPSASHDPLARGPVGAPDRVSGVAFEEKGSPVIL